MLSYQHIYHAGNFADVQKHAILAKVLKAMTAHPAKMRVIDTHAGRGCYDLSSDEAQKTGEHLQGITPFLQSAPAATPIDEYLSIVRDAGLHMYPGSTMIAQKMLRASDHLVAIEKHPGEFEKLAAQMNGHNNVRLLQEDGFLKLASLVPPPERRGLVVIDPSYELKNEYTDLPRQLEAAYKKWPQGTFMIWYPMLESLGHRHMLTAIRASSIRNVLVSEIRLDRAPSESFRMYGTGIALVNSPLPEKILQDVTQFVAKYLPILGFPDVFWLDNKKINPDTGLIQL